MGKDKRTHRLNRIPEQMRKSVRALFYVPYFVDLLGLRDGVFPGVLLLSRRR